MKTEGLIRFLDSSGYLTSTDTKQNYRIFAFNL